MLEGVDSELYRAIHRQPDAIRSIRARCGPDARSAAELLAGCRRVFAVGTGTSGHAALVASYLLREAGVEAYPATSFDFANYPPRLGPEDGVLAISHSGTNRYGIRSIETAVAARTTIVGITGLESPMAGPQVLLRTTPPERSSTHTESYTGNLAAIAMVAVELGARCGRALGTLPADLASLPDHLADILRREEGISRTADRLARSGRLVLAGGGPNGATAREGALKVKESSYLVSEGFDLETILHGGLQPLRRDDVSVAIVVQGPACERAGDVLGTWRMIGTQTLLVADPETARALDSPDDPARETFVVPRVAEALSPITTVLPLQLLAAATAHRRGTNADSFRRDDPVFARVNESYTF